MNIDDVKVIWEPNVYLVGQSEINDSEVSKFLKLEAQPWFTDTDQSQELLSELAGRVCYMSFGDKQGRHSNSEYLGNIIKQSHGSVLEHVSWSFIISGVSRSLSHELVRHRAGFAFSQLSQRYVDESDTAFIVPPLIAELGEDSKAFKSWKMSMLEALISYSEIEKDLSDHLSENNPDGTKRDRRIAARQAARSVLPNSTETKLFVTINARALRHFLEYRGSSFAEVEIRRLALKLATMVQEKAPNIFNDYVIGDSIDTEYRKV